MKKFKKVYSVESGLLNSQYFGLPQNRERIYIVGVKKFKSKKHLKAPNLEKLMKKKWSQNKSVSLKKFLDKTGSPQIDVPWPQVLRMPIIVKKMFR